MADIKLKTYSQKEAVAYLTGMAGQNMIYNVIGAALAYYLQFTILIPAIAVTAIMTVARVWDAFNDPIMGTIVDKTRTKWGKCRPYLIFVPSVIFVVTILCFVNFGFYGQGSKGTDVLIIAWAAFTYILWGMTYTVGDIPLWGAPALMTEDDKDRNKLLGLARIFGGVGAGVTLLCMQPVSLAIGNMLAPSVGAQQGERYGFLIAAVIFSLIGCGLFQFTGLFIKEKIPPSDKKYTLKENFTIIWKNKPFRQILFSGVLGSARNLLAICAMPLVTYYFASKDPILAFVYIGLLGGGMFAGMFVASGITTVLLKKISKKKLYNFSNLLGAVPFLLIFVLYVCNPTGLTGAVYVAIAFVLFVLSGASIGFANVLQSLMIADCIDYEEYTNGTRPDGVFFSGQTFIAKLSSGIATIISGIAYAVVGFSDERVAEVNAFISAGGLPRLAPQYRKLMMIMFFLISIPPAISCILAVIPTWKYCLDDDVHNKIIEELNLRRHADNEEGNYEKAESVTTTVDGAEE